MDGLKKQAENDRVGLNWIARFRWLRARELGIFLWPGDEFSHTRANRLIRGWLKRQLVVVQPLPLRAGFAVMLTKEGRRLVESQGFCVPVGKPIGRSGKTGWRPPADWEHHVLSVAVMADLHCQGFELMTEPEIRASHCGLLKIPDGLAYRGDKTYWLEVENAKKVGRPLTHLAASLSQIVAGEVPAINGLRPNQIIVACIRQAQDERGYALNHPIRVRNAVQRVASHDVPLVWAECELRGSRIEHIRWRQGVIASNQVERIFVKMNQGDWPRDEDGVYSTTFHQFKAYVWEMPDERLWYAQINEETAVAAKSFSAAKRLCAEGIATNIGHLAHRL